MGFASTLAAAGLAGGILLISRGPRVTVRRLAWGWAAAVVLPVCLFVALPTRELLDRYRDLVRFDRISRDARVEIWRDSLAMVASYKWGGCGLGAFEYGFYRFNSRTPMDTVDFAHNDYLQILAELGIVGMVLALTLGLSIVWSLVSLVRAPTGEDWALGVGLLGAFFAIALHSFTDFNLYIPANALVVAWLCGIADSPALRLPSSLC
jgi:O-antigen ligase